MHERVRILVIVLLCAFKALVSHLILLFLHSPRHATCNAIVTRLDLVLLDDGVDLLVNVMHSLIHFLNAEINVEANQRPKY
jgi:hypothetical protein